MRHALFTVIIFISCSDCVFGDLEIYPGINLEDQQNLYELPDGSFAPLYEERRWHEKKAWPRSHQEYFDDEQTQRKFSARIAERYRKFRELLTKQTKELKEKIHNSMKDFVIPENNDGKLKLFSNNEVEHFKYPNQHILEDVRPYPQDSLDFSSHGDENDEGFESDNLLDDDVGDREKIRDTNYYTDENVETDASRQGNFYDAKVSDPTLFAYSPSDPRFYEDSPYLVQREAFDKTLDEYNQQHNLQAESDINRIPYTGAYQEIMDDPRERTENGVKIVAVQSNSSDTDTAGVYIIAVVAGISAAATVGLIAFGIGWYNLQKHVKNASDVEYPAYGITGPNKEISPSGDRRLAQSAQMYHYQHQKQQIIAMERAADSERHGSVSEADSDEENEEGDYTVYEYAGLAPIGEMEVKNPLFQDDPTPAQTPAVKSIEEDIQKK